MYITGWGLKNPDGNPNWEGYDKFTFTLYKTREIARKESKKKPPNRVVKVQVISGGK